MEQDRPRTTAGVQHGILGAYLKRGIAVLVGVAIAVGLFFYFRGTNTTDQVLQQATTLCVCSHCGAMIEKPAGLDCEEINCPGCGNVMGTGAMLAGTGEPAATAGAAAEAVVLPPVQRLARLPVASPVPEGPLCACPNCGKTIARQQGVDCSHVICPNCQTYMTNPVYVGKAAAPPTVGEMKLAGMQGGAGLGGATGHHPFATGVGGTPCPGTTGVAPCPGATGGQVHHHFPTAAAAVNPQSETLATVTYANTIKPIIEKNCYRCHSGQLRNLTTYDNLRPYVDNGLLLMMVQPGGPMSRFISANELHLIDSWVKAGAPP